MSVRKGWLPREGFTADVVQNIVQKTVLNPALTLPLFLLAHYTAGGRGLAIDNPKTLKALKACLYLGIAKRVSDKLDQSALDNWQSAKFDWTKEIVLITGGSDGFGKILVQLFAAKNIKVIILDIQQPTYELPNSNVHFFQVDLTDPAAIRSVSASVKSTHGNPTVLILNAGMCNRHTILNTPDSALTKIVALNQLALFRLTREFLPPMVASNHGMVVTIASQAGYVTPPGMVDYCSTKAAAVSFHEGLSAELVHRYNAPAVRTICVCPNFAATKLAEGFVNKSTFIAPTMHAATVSEAVFEKVMSGHSGHFAVPRIHEGIAMKARSWPWWFQRIIASGLKDVMRGVEIVLPVGEEGGERMGKGEGKED